MPNKFTNHIVFINDELYNYCFCRKLRAITILKSIHICTLVVLPLDTVHYMVANLLSL